MYHNLTGVRFQDTVQAECDRRSDEWALNVKSRLEKVKGDSVNDRVYHQQCSVNFRTGRNVPKQYLSSDCLTPCKVPKTVKMEGSVHMSGFLYAVKHLENNPQSQTTVTALVDKMREYLSGKGQAYSTKHTKRKLKTYLAKNVFFSERDRLECPTLSP